MRPPPTLTPARVARGRARLREERRFARLMERVGPFRLPKKAAPNIFAELFRAIVFQSVSTAAARTIHARIVGLVGASDDPSKVLALDRETLRGAGLSYAKADALLDLSRRSSAGLVPDTAAAILLPDDALIERLTQIRGIGRWTVEMLLIFGFRRADVLPVDDLGVRRGYQLAYHKQHEPTRRELAEFGQRWAPYRTVASWYLWRATELEW